MLKLVFAVLLIATPAIAQEAKLDILAIDEEDAQWRERVPHDH